MPNKPCVWNGIQYPSIKDAAAALNLSKTAMRWRVNRGYVCDEDMPQNQVPEPEPEPEPAKREFKYQRRRNTSELELTLTPATVENLRILAAAPNHVEYTCRLEPRALSRMVLCDPPLAQFTAARRAGEPRHDVRGKARLTQAGIAMVRALRDVEPDADGRYTVRVDAVILSEAS